MSSIFLPLIFLPTRLLVPAVGSEGKKMGGRKMKSKSSPQTLSHRDFLRDLDALACHCERDRRRTLAKALSRKDKKDIRR